MLEASVRSKLLVLVIALTVAVATTIAVLRVRRASLTLTGVVLRQDTDPQRQIPIHNVKITATDGERTIEGTSESSGLFHLKLVNNRWRERPLTMTFQHPDYRPITTTVLLKKDLYVVRMVPTSALVQPTTPATTIKHVRIRYAEKALEAVDIGSTVKTFVVPNTGNVPCRSTPPCSPDGAWKASLGGITIDAGDGQQYTHVRVSCIAGPCSFSRVESGTTPDSARVIKVTVRNWSDTVTFLVEAEVTRNAPTDVERVAYPAIYGRTMSFTLPGTGEGPSIEAEVGGTDIVFPLGPELLLSWQNCTMQVSPDRTKLYRCELKPGYEFQ